MNSSHSRKASSLGQRAATGRDELYKVGLVPRIALPKGSLPDSPPPRRFTEKPLQWDVCHVPMNETVIVPDMVKFLICWEVVTSRFWKFNYRPHSYWSYEILLHQLQDVDLLVQDSAAPAAGLPLAWKLQDEAHGATEAANFKKISNFPQISNEDNLRLFSHQIKPNQSKSMGGRELILHLASLSLVSASRLVALRNKD